MGKSGTQLFLLRLLTILLFNPGMPALHELRNLTVLPIIPIVRVRLKTAGPTCRHKRYLGGYLGGYVGSSRSFAIRWKSLPVSINLTFVTSVSGSTNFSKGTKEILN